MNRIRISAAVITNQHGKTLVVRKRGTTHFMQAGGKIDLDETPKDALTRELFEELSIAVGPEQFDYCGHYEAPAANEDASIVDAQIYYFQWDQAIKPAAEIAQVCWIDPFDVPEMSLAPLTEKYCIPLAQKHINRPA